MDEGKRCPHVCLVSVSNGGVESSCSGILIDNRRGIVLSHATVLQPLIKKVPILSKLLENEQFIETSQNEQINLKFQVIFENFDLKPVDKTAPSIVTELCNHENIMNSSMMNLNNGEEKSIKRYEGYIVNIFKVVSFANILSKLFPPQEEWKFADSSIPNGIADNTKSLESIDKDCTIKLLPMFVCIKLNQWQPNHTYPLNICDERGMLKGIPVYAIGTPFGTLSPSVFLNSVSQGVISNMVLNSDNSLALILTDARCIPGCEGGALFLKKKSNYGKEQLAGIIVASLCWKANEWVGLSIVCPVNQILKSLQRSSKLEQIPLSIPFTPKIYTSIHEKSISTLSQVPVVVVHCGATWGSGIIVDLFQGIILTCGHVVKKASEGYQVRVSYDGSIWRSSAAEIIFVIGEHKVFDIAILRLQRTISGLNNANENMKAAVASNKLREGEDVFVLGHGVFEDRHLPSWSVTKGVISRVISVNSVPVIIQSTCAVHPGASGGALVNSDGKLVGMIVCNAKDAVAGVCYPHVNLSIPAQTIWPAIKQYCLSKDIGDLANLHIKNPSVQKLWTLSPLDKTIGPSSRL